MTLPSPERLLMLASDIDDESPQVLAAVLARALESGALDAVAIPVQMKKGRPGTRVEILCRPADREALVTLLLLETSTLGVRVAEVERHALDRRMETVSVHGHPVRLKVAVWGGKVLRATPEFEDCRTAAQALGLPVRDVIEAARREWELHRPDR